MSWYRAEDSNRQPEPGTAGLPGTQRDGAPIGQRIRVLRVITRLNVGGPTRHVVMLKDGLSSEHFEQRVVAGEPEAHEGEGVLSSGEGVERLPGLVRTISPRCDLLARRGLRTIIRAFRPHIVHTHQAKAGALARSVAFQEGVPVVVHTYHGHTFEGYFSRPVGFVFRWVERRLATRSQALICQSPSQASDIERYLGPKARAKVVVIPPAIPAEFFTIPISKTLARRRLGLSLSDFVLVLPTRLEPIKNVAAALKMFAGILAERTAVLLVAGDGSEMGSLERLARHLGISGQVRWLGNCREIQPLYLAADWMILTSLAEGTPLSIIEAMASGTAVAATAVGGVRDIVGPDGLLLDPRADPSAWAKTLLNAESHALEKEAFIARAKERCRVLADENRLIRDVSALYFRLFAEASAMSAGESSFSVM